MYLLDFFGRGSDGEALFGGAVGGLGWRAAGLRAECGGVLCVDWCFAQLVLSMAPEAGSGGQASDKIRAGKRVTIGFRRDAKAVGQEGVDVQ